MSILRDEMPDFAVRHVVRRRYRRHGQKEREAEIVRRWLLREKPDTIAQAVGITRNALDSTVCRLRKRGIPLPTLVQNGVAHKCAPKGVARG
jgi:hypothetical protein